MSNIVIFKHSAVPAADNGVVNTGAIAMCKWSQVTPLLGLYLDMANNWRLHTGQHEGGFRGYAMEQGGVWMVEVWSAKLGGYAQPPIAYKTEAGALRALERMAKWIEA